MTTMSPGLQMSIALKAAARSEARVLTVTAVPTRRIPSKSRSYVRGHRIESSHAVRNGARNRVIGQQIPEALHDFSRRPYNGFVYHHGTLSDRVLGRRTQSRFSLYQLLHHTNGGPVAKTFMLPGAK